MSPEQIDAARSSVIDAITFLSSFTSSAMGIIFIIAGVIGVFSLIVFVPRALYRAVYSGV